MKKTSLTLELARIFNLWLSLVQKESFQMIQIYIRNQLGGPISHKMFVKIALFKRAAHLCAKVTFHMRSFMPAHRMQKQRFMKKLKIPRTKTIAPIRHQRCRRRKQRL